MPVSHDSGLLLPGLFYTYEEAVRAFPCGPAELCWLSYTPENTTAGELYHSLGFRETGELVDEELVAVLPLAGAGSETED